jgi:ketosteroid isomerase-like protein
VSKAIEEQILAAEERLRLAMLGSDVSALDELLSPELVFTSHLGHVLKKKDDLAAHRSGLVKIDELTPSEQTVQLHGDVAIVSVRVHLSGSYAGTPSEADFRFTRVWALSPSGTWQVVAGHACIVA